MFCLSKTEKHQGIFPRNTAWHCSHINKCFKV